MFCISLQRRALERELSIKQKRASKKELCFRFENSSFPWSPWKRSRVVSNVDLFLNENYMVFGQTLYSIIISTQICHSRPGVPEGTCLLIIIKELGSRFRGNDRINIQE